MKPLFYNLSFDIWPIGLVLLIIPWAILIYKKRSFYYILCVSIFCVYLLYVTQQVFFPLEINGDYAEYMRREVPFMSFVNFVPFYFGPFATLQSSFQTIILNIILTIPFGFGINFIVNVKGKNFLWIAPAVGFSLEIAQLIISLLLRYPYRLIDINDVIMNTVGVLIGYTAFRVFAWTYLWITQKFTINHEGVHGYIYDIVNFKIPR